MIAEVGVVAPHLVRGAADRAFEQVADPLLQEERAACWVLPERLDVGHESRHEQEVKRPIAYYLISDMNIVTFDVMGCRPILQP